MSLSNQKKMMVISLSLSNQENDENNQKWEYGVILALMRIVINTVSKYE